MKYASFLVRAPCIRTKGVGCPFLAQKNWKNLGVTENCSHIYLLNELLPDRNLNIYGEFCQYLLTFGKENSSVQSIQWTCSFGKGKFKIGEMFYACKNINHDEKFRS